MSDPLKNADIEDVLSSIRRLVSDDSRVRPAPAPFAVERLVLTPALRVTEPVAPLWPETGPETGPETDISPDSAPQMQDPAPQDFGLQADAAPEPEWQEETAAERAEPHAPEPAEHFPEAAQTPDDPQPTETGHTEAGQTDTGQTEAVVAQEGSDDAGQWAATPEESMTEAPQVDQPTGDTGPLTLDAWSADGTGADLAGKSGNDVLEWEDHLDGDAATLSDAATDAATDAAALASAPPEPAVQAQQDIPHVAAAAAAAIPVEESLDLTADDTLLDEETLRELVAEIVRQELQGALGERITRNVRKLVRREIHRALSSQEFE